MSEAPSEAVHSESHDSETTRETGGSYWLLWCFVLLLFAYPLSIGPVARFYKGQRPPRAVIVFYQPIDVVYKTSAGGKVFDWYLHLWGAR